MSHKMEMVDTLVQLEKCQVPYQKRQAVLAMVDEDSKNFRSAMQIVICYCVLFYCISCLNELIISSICKQAIKEWSERLRIESSVMAAPCN